MEKVVDSFDNACVQLFHKHRLLPPDINIAQDAVSTTIKSEMEENEVEIIEEKRTKQFSQNMVNYQFISKIILTIQQKNHHLSCLRVLLLTFPQKLKRKKKISMATNPAVIYKMISMTKQHPKCLMNKLPRKLCFCYPRHEKVNVKGI